jgi:hypothetical protein
MVRRAPLTSHAERALWIAFAHRDPGGQPMTPSWVSSSIWRVTVGVTQAGGRTEPAASRRRGGQKLGPEPGSDPTLDARRGQVGSVRTDADTARGERELAARGNARAEVHDPDARMGCGNVTQHPVPVGHPLRLILGIKAPV